MLEREEKAFLFALRYGLIDNQKYCDNHTTPLAMHLIKFNQAKYSFIWRCPICNATKTLPKNSIFESSKLSILRVLGIIYCWSHRYSLSQTQNETKVSHHTFSSIFRLMSMATLTKKNTNQKLKIGGPGKNVEIDETLFSKRKHHKGRFINERWVFGGICREDKTIFLEYVPNRTSDVLFNCILDIIELGSTIHSDKWASNNVLDSQPQPHPFLHQTVNHSQNFIDPDTQFNTQQIERLWRDFKEDKVSKHGIPFQDMNVYIAEYLWRREMKNSTNDIF